VAGAVFGGAVIGTGVGSLLYHRPQWPGSAFVHDAAIASAVLFVTVDDLALLRGGSEDIMTLLTRGGTIARTAKAVVDGRGM
jgi:hypothetical protein